MDRRESIDPLVPVERYPDREFPLNVSRALRTPDDVVRCYITVTEDRVNNTYVAELSTVSGHRTEHYLVVPDLKLQTVMHTAENYLEKMGIDKLT